MLRLVAVALCVPFTLAADTDPAKAPKEKLAALVEAEKAAEAGCRAAATALPNTKEGNAESDKLWKAYDKSRADRFAAAVEIAKTDPKSDDAFAALEWVLMTGRALYLPAGMPAVQLVSEHHAANPRIGKLAARLAWYPPPPGENAHKPVMALLTAVAEKNPDRTTRGQAQFGLALQANWDFGVAEYKKGKDIDALAVAAEKAFEAVVKEYGDCRWLLRDGMSTLGEVAAGHLFELRHLRVGKVAPAIAGKDLDDKEFATDGHKGKVRLIVFWASWCGPCMQMVPQEKKMVERLKGRPFVLIGVNGDEDRAKGKEAAEAKGMAWRSFWNGKDGSKGGIAEAWNVRGWPTIYGLDGKGVIRFKGLVGKELDAAVDELVAEAEKAEKK